MKKNALQTAIQIVAGVLGMFSGFLMNVAPTKGAGAVGGICALLALLLATWAHRLPKLKRGSFWFRTAVIVTVAAVVALPWYWLRYEGTSVEVKVHAIDGDTWESERLIIGDYTEEASAFLKRSPGLSNADLLRNFGGVSKVERVWTRESIERNKNRLTLVYSVCVMLLVLAVGLFAEATKK